MIFLLFLLEPTEFIKPQPKKKKKSGWAKKKKTNNLQNVKRRTILPFSFTITKITFTFQPTKQHRENVIRQFEMININFFEPIIISSLPSTPQEVVANDNENLSLFGIIPP